MKRKPKSYVIGAFILLFPFILIASFIYLSTLMFLTLMGMDMKTFMPTLNSKPTSPIPNPVPFPKPRWDQSRLMMDQFRLRQSLAKHQPICKNNIYFTLFGGNHNAIKKRKIPKSHLGEHKRTRA